VVTCERCHRKFPSYAALLQHYRGKHSNITDVSELENKVIAERETESLRKAQTLPHGSSRLKLVAFVLIVIVALGAVGYVAFTPKEQPSKRLGVGSTAPDFSLPDVAGGTFRLSDYRGKSSVLLFFSEGLACQPCLTQMHDLDQVNSQLKSMNTIVVSITGDQLQLLADWVRSSGPRYGFVLSDQGLAVSRMYDMLGADVSMMPGTAPGHTFVLVSKAGVIVWRQDYGPYNMYVPNDQILAAVRKALGS
jgi:peroxiredoxin